MDRNVSLILEYINIEGASNCQYDSLTILETDGFYYEKFCDFNDSYIYLDLVGEVNIVFESDGSQGTQDGSEPAGFVISYEIDDPCNPNPCLNGGLCNEGTCSCSDRYRGDYCEIEKDFCELFTCINGQVCVFRLLPFFVRFSATTHNATVTLDTKEACAKTKLMSALMLTATEGNV